MFCVVTHTAVSQLGYSQHMVAQQKDNNGKRALSTNVITTDAGAHSVLHHLWSPLPALHMFVFNTSTFQNDSPSGLCVLLSESFICCIF